MTDAGKGLKDRGVSVVLGTYNRKGLLKLTIDCIRTELSGAGFPHEIIVVDGGSMDGTRAWLTSQKDIISIVQHNRGEWKGKPIERRSWGYFTNLGFKCAQGKYICMLSDDALVVPGAIRKGVAHFERRLSDGTNVGAVAFYFLNYPVQSQYYVIRLGRYLYVNHGLYLNDALRSVGYIDETAYRFYAADVDLCLRMRAQGYTIEPCPDSRVIHFSHINLRAKASNQLSEARDVQALRTRWSTVLTDVDPDFGQSPDYLPNQYVTKTDFYRNSLALRAAVLRCQLVTGLVRSRMIRRLANAIGENRIRRILAKS